MTNPERADPVSITRAKELRRRMTREEALLWKHIRNGALGVHFRRQHPIGPYIADFACLLPRLVVEADGSQHLESEYDRIRDAYIRSQGFVILRFWNEEVWTQIEWTKRRISAELDLLDPTRLHRR